MELKLTDDNFDEEVLKSTIPVLVDFWAEWCAPCLMIAPTVEEIAREYEGKLKVGKLNVDEGHGSASRYGIRGIPSLLLFKGGQVVDRIVGVVSRAALEEKLRPHVEGR